MTRHKNKVRRTTPVTEMVDRILRNVPEARNSDITLMIEIWRHYYPSRIITSATSGAQAVRLSDLYTLPREDAIKRERAALNAEGKYYPTDWEVAKGRGIKEDEWRVALGYPRKDETVKPTKDESYMDPERGFALKRERGRV